MKDEEKRWEGVSATKFAIIEAYVDLMEEEPYTKIKVKEIVERCGVARSTFYTHFQDSLDVLEHIESYLLNSLQLYSHEKSLEYSQNGDLPFHAMVRWFESCREARHTLHALFGPNGDPYFKTRLANNLRKSFREMMNDDQAPDDKFRHFFIELQTAAYLGLLEYVANLRDDDELISAYDMVWVANAARSAYEHHLLDHPSDETPNDA